MGRVLVDGRDCDADEDGGFVLGSYCVAAVLYSTSRRSRRRLRVLYTSMEVRITAPVPDNTITTHPTHPCEIHDIEAVVPLLSHSVRFPFLSFSDGKDKARENTERIEKGRRQRCRLDVPTTLPNPFLVLPSVLPRYGGIFAKNQCLLLQSQRKNRWRKCQSKN